MIMMSKNYIPILVATPILGVAIFWAMLVLLAQSTVNALGFIGPLFGFAIPFILFAWFALRFRKSTETENDKKDAKTRD